MQNTEKELPRKTTAKFVNNVPSLSPPQGFPCFSVNFYGFPCFPVIFCMNSDDYVCGRKRN